MDIAEVHSRALDATRGVIAGVRHGQWAAPTPCQGWDVRALVNHVVSGNLCGPPSSPPARPSARSAITSTAICSAQTRSAHTTPRQRRRRPYSPSRARSRRRALSPTARSPARYTPVTVSSTCSSTAGTWPSPPGRTRSSPCPGGCVPRHRRPSSGAPACQRRVRRQDRAGGRQRCANPSAGHAGATSVK
jgi:Mycothiol maleylpyruvate isomerase N-terminal domain